MIPIIKSLAAATRFFKQRFFTLFLILYVGSLLQQILRFIFLTELNISRYTNLPSIVTGMAILEKISSEKYLLLLPLAWILIGIWMYGVLYVSLGGSPLGMAIAAGLKNMHRYFGFVIAATVLSLILLFILTVPGLILMGRISPHAFFDKTSSIFLVPIALILMLPGIATVISLSNGPFILLLENKGILESMRESFRRVYPVLVPAGALLGIGVLAGAAAYYLMLWIVFRIEVLLVPADQITVQRLVALIVNGVPWVIAAGWFDALVYQMYTRLKLNLVAPPDQHVAS